VCIIPASIAWNQSPLPQNRLAALPLTAIRPEGWLLTAIAQSAPRTEEARLYAAALLGQSVQAPSADFPPDKHALRALMAYHGMTSDAGTLRALLAHVKTLRDQLAGAGFADARSAADMGDWLRACIWLYNLTGQKALLLLLKQIKAQAPDWMSTFHTFAQTGAVKQAPAQDTDAYWRAHGATVAAALKIPALQALFEGGLKNETGFQVGWEKLRRHHGAAHGLFNASPLLGGNDPSREMDDAVVTELIESLGVLLQAQGDAAVGDLLETAVYNAVPAMGGRQAANQLIAPAPAPDGYAAYAAQLFMATRDGGLAAVGYAPCAVRWRIGGQLVRLDVETRYPAEETVTIRLRLGEAARFPLYLRIPAWAEGATVVVNDEEAAPLEPGFARLEREWQGGDALHLRLPMAVRALPGARRSVSVARGPVVYALPVVAGQPWAMALLPEMGCEVDASGAEPIVYAKAAPVPQWTASGKRPGAMPVAPEVKAEAVRRVALRPYGKCGARIAQFPQGIIVSTEEKI
jgi:hypothetical protein